MLRHSRSGLFAQFMTFCRELRHHGSPRGGAASPGLMFAVTVLALLLAIVVVERYRAELQSIGLIAAVETVPPLFTAP